MTEDRLPFPESKPRCAQKAPFPVETEAGKRYAWCTCGRSNIQPMCDGAHKGSGFKPVFHIAEKTETVYFCGCKQTQTPPFCDGTHSGL